MPPHKLFTQGVVSADENIHKLSPFGGKALLQGIQFKGLVFGFCWLVGFFCFSWKSVVFLFVLLLFWVLFVGFFGFCLFGFICFLFCFCGGGNGRKGKVRGQKTQGPEESLLALLQIIPLCIYHTTCVLILAQLMKEGFFSLCCFQVVVAC